MIEQRFRVLVNGVPMRFYVNSRTKEKMAIPNAKEANEFPTEDRAKKRADSHGLTAYEVVPFMRDLGTVTRLTEVAI